MLKRTHSNEPDGQPDYERQLQMYQKKIASILESFTDAFFEVDCNWTVTYWNKEAERLLAMAREDIIGKNLWEVYRDAIPLKFYTEYHRAVNEHVAVRFEEYFAPKDLWVEVAAFPSGEGLSVYFKDISARKQAGKILEREREKYRDLFNFSPLPQWVYDLETLAFLQVNEAAIALYGYSREEFLAMTIEDIRPEGEDVAVLKEIIETKVKMGMYHQSVVKHRKKNGDVIFVRVEGNSVSYEDRNARLVLAIDQTEKIEAEEELQRSLDRYDVVSKATSDAIWEWDIRSGEVNWNKGIAGIFGHKDVENSYSWWESKVHPDDIGRVRSQLAAMIALKNPRHQVEYRFRCSDGGYKTILDRSFILFDSEGEPVRVIGSMQDISERVRNLRAIESQNERLRDIAWLQAHKVRAPLARIMALAQLVDAEDECNLEEIKELIRLIRSSADELDMVIGEILKKSS